jgi:hypothetical protein
MNKKNRTYILIIAVVAVWGTIGFKIYSNLNPSMPKAKAVGEIQFKRIEKKASEKIEIQPNYRDPFLGKLYKEKKRTVKTKKIVHKDPVQFPPINFIGLIEGKSVSYIIQINNQQEIFKLGQTFQGVTLKSAKSKEVTVKYKGKSKTILLRK